MSKYTGKFKIDLVQEYQLGQASYKTLSQKYHVPSTMIRKWVLLANDHGLDALHKKQNHKKYSLEEKLAVVDYYQTNDEGAVKVAAKLNLNPSQVASWARITVLHTDITQVRLANHRWGYISVVMDGASREIITAVISEHANLKQLASTIDNLAVKLPINSKPILHSDQGWQYQHSLYQNAIKKLGITPSMSRRGNCHDNAPMESFFNLMKRECLYRATIDNLDDLNRIVTEYIAWYNNQRISINKNGLTPVEFREQAIV